MALIFIMLPGFSKGTEPGMPPITIMRFVKKKKIEQVTTCHLTVY